MDQMLDELKLNKLIFYTSPIGLFVYKSSGQCILANQNGAKIIGTTLEKALSQNFRELKSWERSGMLWAADKALGQKTVENIEVNLTTTYGREVWLALSFSSFKYQGEMHLLVQAMEITDLKQSQEEREELLKIYKESAENINALMSLNTGSVFLMTTDGIIIDCNNGLLQKFNITKEAIIGKHATEVIPNNVYDFRKQYIDKAVNTKMTIQFEDTVNGRSYEHMLYPIIDDKGDVLRILTFTSDITDKIINEENLKTSLKKIELLFDFIPDGISILDRDRKVIKHNPALERILKISKDDLLNSRFNNRKYFKADGSNMELHEFPTLQILSGDERWVNDVDVGVQIEDGSTIWTSVSATKGPTNDWQAVVVTKDITDRKNLEIKIKRDSKFNLSKANLTKLMLTTNNIAAISSLFLNYAKDLTSSTYGFVGYINPKTGRLETPAISHEVWEGCEKEHKDVAFKHSQGLWSTVLNNKKSLYVNDVFKEGLNVNAPDGHKNIKNFISAPALLNGKLVGQIALINKLVNYTEEDLKIVEELTDLYAIAIGRMYDEKDKTDLENKLFHSAKLASIGTLAAGIAHEINNPLTVIRGIISILGKEEADKQDEIKRKACMDRLLSSTDRIEKIVKGLSSYAHVSSDKIETIDVTKYIEESLSIYGNMIEKDGIHIIRNYKAKNPKINIDPNKFQQIFINLLNNAKDAFPDNTEDAKILIEIADENNFIEMKIIDNGLGIPEEIKPRLFDPFFTTKPVGKGTGLGLSIIHSIIKSCGGTISFESMKDKGTTFIVNLPRTSASINYELNSKDKAKDALIVDDEADIRSILTNHLKQIKINVSQAQNGKEALSKLCEKEFDFVFLDLKMPEFSGFDFLKELTNITVPEKTKFIITTGCSLSDYNEEERAFLHRHGHAFLFKPFGEKEVTTIINTITAGGGAARQMMGNSFF